MAPHMKGATVERLQRVMRRLGWEHPFFLPLLARATFVEDEGVGTAAVTTHGKIFISPKFAATLTDAELAGIGAHELCHPALRHHTRQGNRPADMWNIATDQAINAGLRAAGITLPAGALYPPVGMEAASAEELYELLAKQPKPQPKPQPQPQEAGEQGEGEGEGEGDAGGEDSGSGKLEPQAPAAQGCGVIPDPDDADGDGEEEDDREWRAAAHEAKSLARTAGDSGAAALARIVEIPASRVTWEQLLRGATAQAAGAHGRDDVTFSRRNRRSPAVGAQIPGWRAQRPRVGVVIDSSGSVDDASLTRAIAETVRICTATQTRVFLVVHSAHVQFAGWLARNTRVADVKAHVTDRGGTCFLPAYHALRDAGHLDTVVHLTDGEPCDAWPALPASARRLVVALVGTATRDYAPRNARIVDVRIG